MTPAEHLEAAVRAGDEAAIREQLGSLTEAERSELQPDVRAFVAAEVKQGIAAVGRLGPTLLAAYGTLPASDLRRLGWRSLHVPDHLEDVLRARSLARLEPIVDVLLEVGGPRAWYPVRALVRDGVVPLPDGPAYTVALLAATQYRLAGDLVADDPGVLDVEAWRLFEVEGGGEHSLAAFEKYTGDSWGDLFRAQAAGDRTMRARLLDTSLAALARDFGAFRAGWFSRFHETLAPTVEERAERSSEYGRLLRSRTRPTVSFAVAALAQVSQAGCLEPEALLGSVGPVLSEAPAGTAKAALKLVARAGLDEAHAPAAALAAADALANPSADVQQAALTLLDVLVPGRDDVVAQAVAGRLADIAPSRRGAALVTLARLGGEPAAGRSGPREPVPTAETSAHDRSRPPSLDDARAVIPIETIEELIETAVSVIETGEPAEELERVLDAVGRLAVERSAGFSRSTAALARRCRAIIDHRDSRVFSGADARADIAAVLWSWATGALVSATVQASEGSGVGAFLSARAAELAASPRDDAPRSTVALPTHVGGWIDPTQLVERLRSHPPASRLDLVAALLRLAIEGRPEALRAARDLEGESGAALRYALGGDERIGATASWWVAAARVRAPGEDDDALERRHPGLGPDAGRAARASIVAPAGRTGTTGLALVVEPRAKGPAALDLPTVLPYRSALARWWSGPSTPMLRWIATVQPGDREPWATVGSLVMARNLDWWSAEWANRVYLEPFIDPLTRVGPQARRLLGIALGAKEAGERGLASDIVGLLLGDGRLTGGSLGGGLIAAAELGCDRPARWAFSLADVAARSPGHAAGVVEAIGTTMAAIADRRPGTLVPLLRLLEELLAAVGGSLSPEAGVTLQSLAGRGGQTGRLARSIAARP